MLAAASATIREFRRLNLVERAQEMEPYVGDRLRALQSGHPSVGDVRGKGLFWAVDLVSNRERKTPFNTKAEKLAGKPLVVDQVTAEMMRNGVAVQGWISHLVIAPPLIITKAEIDLAMDVLDRALKIADQALATTAGVTPSA
jgi:taurine--2-oxoglutarate transaminase